MCSKVNEDDLEYHITFPAPDQNHLSESIKFDLEKDQIARCGSVFKSPYLNISRCTKEPVIFLLGWFGCQDRYLAKYSSLYNKLGCITVRYTAPPDSLYFGTDSKLKPTAKKLIKLMDETSLSHHPIIFHNFSNNGSIVYSYISATFENCKEMPMNVKGCIFDSSPSPRRWWSGVRAVYPSTKGSTLLKMIAAGVLGLYFGLWGVYRLFLILVTGRINTRPPWTLVQERFTWPQLFLYSKADDLISYKDIELFAASRKNIASEVFTHEFKESGHVEHYRYFPNEYMSAVGSFVDFCVRDPEAKPVVKPKKVSES